MGTEITLLKWPGEEDWMFAKSCCPEFRGLMAPPCAFMDECPEMEPCKEGQA